jgi:hypothetical protein
MGMSNAANSRIEIRACQFYSDGSGAPATVICAGYIFACDWLGTYRATLVRPVSGSRTDGKIAARRVEQAYTKFVAENAPAGWMTANAYLYR